MKKIFICVLALLLVNSAFGQGNFEVGSNVIGVGIGFGNSDDAFDVGSETPAISFQYEHGKWAVGGPGVISLGGYLGFKGGSYDYSIYNNSWSYIILGVRSAYHFNMIQSSDFDVYGGLMLGLEFANYDSNAPGFRDGSDTDFELDIFLGGRYYFNQNWAGFAEIGSGIGLINLGVAYKF